MGSLTKEIKETRKRLNTYREAEDIAHQREVIGKLEVSLEKLLLKEEIYWKQRSRNKWLASGDRNTTFFHKSATARRKINWIYGLSDGHNNPTSKQKEIEKIVIDFYSVMFTSQNPSSLDIKTITNLMPPAVTHDMNRCLSQPFTRDEIHKALFDLNPSKAPGPDNFTTLFFQDAWDIIRNKFTTEALGVLNNGDSLKNWNSDRKSVV